MLDVKWIKENPEALDLMLEKRGMEPLSQKIIAIEEEMRQIVTVIQALQAAKKKKAENIQAIGNNKRDPNYITFHKDAEHLRYKISQLEEKYRNNDALKQILDKVPNILEENVPRGTSENDNVMIRENGTVKEFSFKPKAHYEIGNNNSYIDLNAGVSLSGSRFVVLKNEIALLERAIMNFMLDVQTKEFGYVEYSVPFMVLEEAMYGAGQLPKFELDSFKVEDKYRLIPTGEVPLINLIKDKVLDLKDLPMRLVTYTPCFRSEVGSAGRDTKGMVRLHQFSKVELVSIVKPEDSQIEHERITSNAEAILKKLDLPYRVMLLCSGDTGFTSRKTYDLEVWLPSQKKYREISSCSNCGDFQSRRINAKIKHPDNKKYYPHTLNGSGLPVGRTLVAILENYQNEDGSVTIPTALQPYVGTTKICLP
jgi:seryl-tRNA synthetase